MRGIDRSMLGTRDEMLRLGERMMLCARAAEPPNPASSDRTASKDSNAGRIFRRRSASPCIMEFQPYASASLLMALPRQD